MIRSLSLAAVVAVALSVPALAEPATRGNLFTEQQARNHLSHQGYTGISGLSKDENGVWQGSATKDGQTRTVAVDIKGGVAKN